MLLVQAPFEKSAGVHAGRGMWLEKYQVRTLLRLRPVKEVIEPDFEDLGRRSITGNMAAQVPVGLVGPDHHRERIPVDNRRNALLQRHIPWVRHLFAQ